MKFIQEGTTKRYIGKKNCDFDNFVPSKEDLYQYGCEFEFYIDTDKYGYYTAIDNITQELYTLTSVDILVDTVGLPSAKDKDQCIQIKPDISLQDNGIEISVPISSIVGIKYFIETISRLIDKYGYTNEETGFHIHISTVKQDGVNFNFYKYMLLCNDAKLLSSWKPRIGYSQSVMDILSSNSRQESRKIKNKKGTVWNLEKVENNHVEIKSIGGDDYHKEIDRIIEEFSLYAHYFDETLQPNTAEHKRLFEEHKKMIANVENEIKVSFVSALSATGILPKDREE